jgi:hypothetical protein
VLIQFDSPDDEHWVARNMQRSEINTYIEKSASSWLLTRIRTADEKLADFKGKPKLWKRNVQVLYDIAL